jgi:multidrug efflux pump subunit AcrB
MGVVLPVSLLLSFSLLYVFNISLNIISLSGLALGLGMLVDNSVVVIDNIMLKRKEGHNLLDSYVSGTSEVAAPLLSSALTNIAVFVPLIFMGGINGELFYDQALSVVAILSASMLCTFILVPLTYLLLFKNLKKETREDSRFFLAMRAGYHRSFLFVWKHKKISLLLMSLLIPVAFFLFWFLPKEAMPEIERTETLVSIDWNEPIGLDENRKRTTEMCKQSTALITEADAGFRQFTFGSEQYPVQQVDVYLRFQDAATRSRMNQKLSIWFLKRYPQAQVQFKNAPNPFEQIFANNKPLLEVRFRDFDSKKLLSRNRADSLLAKVKDQTEAKPGKGFEKETVISLRLNFEKLSDFKINYEQVVNELRRLFDDFPVTQLRSFSDNTPIVFKQTELNFEEKLNSGFVTDENGSDFPLHQFMGVSYKEDYRNVTADQAGIYQSIELKNPDQAFAKSDTLNKTAVQFNTSVDWVGEWFENQKNFKQLLFIMLISILLMYFILTAEFESLKQPLLVLSSFPIGLAGSLLLLWLCGETINVMSGIGLVVVLGILDNDAILKIDRINTLRKTMPLEKAIEQAGLDRLKPIVMNTLTNVLAITPIIFSSGLGADLQRPVALATIGGLLVATLAALYFIPLMYWATSPTKAKT